MEATTLITLQWSDWWQLFQHFIGLSMLSVGGAISTLPEMHRFLVEQHHWLSEAQFTASVAIAQAAPGPNVLFIALLGWNIGVNAGGYLTGMLGVLICMFGILLPSTSLTYLAAGWLGRNAGMPAVRAFKQGLAPIVIALLIATGWIMASAHPAGEWHLWLVTMVAALLIWRTRIHMLWLIFAGALLGWFGFI